MSRLPARRPMPEGYVEFGAESVFRFSARSLGIR